MIGALARLTTTTRLAALGFVIAVAGSVAPWLNDEGSVGLGDSPVTLIAFAGIGFLLFQSRVECRLIAVAAAITVLAIAVYNLVQLQHEIDHARHLYGTSSLSIGWGLYATVVGGAIAVAPLIYEIFRTPGTNDSGAPAVEV